MLGLFFLGMFTRRADQRGALVGCLIGFVLPLSLWLYQSGAFAAAGSPKPAPLVSFVWFSVIGAGITLLAGLIFSGRKPR
jgi:sodium-coupled monocarboxylate transporter 8/12